MRIRNVVLAGVLSSFVLGCYSRSRAAQPQGGRYLITQQELNTMSSMTLYEAVAKLRPHFLRNRSSTAFGKNPGRQLMLYVNGEKMDGVDDLRRLWPSDVAEVRFYEPQLANTYFARYNNAGGAIAVTLRKLDDVISPSTQE
jgi:hypothetical protein